MQHTTKLNLNVLEQTDKILDSVTALGQNAIIIDGAISTSITSASTNSEIAGSKAVYDAINPYMQDISSQITNTAESGVTIASLTAYKYNNFLILNIQCTYSSTSTRVKDLLTIEGYTGAMGYAGSGRTYDSPASTTVYGASGYINSSGKITIFASATHRGAILSFIVPMPTLS